MKTVVKYCKAEHHFTKTNTFRLGTLQQYREHENIDIADPFEGLTATYRFKNPYEIININSHLIESLTGGRIKFNYSGDAIQINPGGALILNERHEIQNQYIWCTSDQKYGNEETATSLGYDCWYKIVDIDGFMDALYAAMAPNARFLNKISIPYQLDKIHRKVNYSADKHIKSYTGRVNPLTDAVFTKPLRSQKDPNVDYTKNVEYRMLWKMYDKNTNLIHTVRKEAIEFDFTDAMKSYCK
jgi:hypothetical protein